MFCRGGGLRLISSVPGLGRGAVRSPARFAGDPLHLVDGVACELVDLGGFVEHGVGACGQAALAHGRGGVAGQHDDFLPQVAVAAAFDHIQAVALQQKQVDHGQVPGAGVVGQPLAGLVFAAGPAHHAGADQLFQGLGQVGADDGAVFDQKDSQAHRESG